MIKARIKAKAKEEFYNVDKQCITLPFETCSIMKRLISKIILIVLQESNNKGLIRACPMYEDKIERLQSYISM